MKTEAGHERGADACVSGLLQALIQEAMQLSNAITPTDEASTNSLEKVGVEVIALDDAAKAGKAELSKIQIERAS
jgi:hypothetical protein